MSARNDAEDFATELRKALTGRSGTDRKIILVGVLNKYLAPRKAVLVGGALVEFYTSGGYVTGDIDLIGDGESIRRLLRAAGFEKSDRYFASMEFELMIDVAGFVLRSDESIDYVNFEGYLIPLLSIEDAVLDRLMAAKFWKSRTDWEQAILLYAAHRSRLDMGKLSDKAGLNDVKDFLKRLEADVKGKGGQARRPS